VPGTVAKAMRPQVAWNNVPLDESTTAGHTSRAQRQDCARTWSM